MLIERTLIQTGKKITNSNRKMNKGNRQLKRNEMATMLIKLPISLSKKC